MNKFKGIMWGLIFIAIGIILGGNSLGLFNINIFFKGWWTLFIIIPSLVGVVTERDKAGSFIGLLIGIGLLLACKGLISYGLIMKLLLPILIVGIGISIIIKNMMDNDVNSNIKEINKKIDSEEGYAATFSGQDVNLNGEKFKGTNLNAVFGGIKLDLRNAIIKEDVVINASSIFGGIDIFVPDGFAIKVKSNSFFGGVSNKKNTNVKEGAHTIYINATCMFGGVDIK